MGGSCNVSFEQMPVMNGMNPIKPGGLGGANPIEKTGLNQGQNQGPASKSGVDFKKALEQAATTEQTKSLQNPATVGNTQKVGANLGVASTTLAASQQTSLKFSNHAIERMHSRGIAFGADEMKGIENAITKAAQKGAKDTLVLSGDNALIVSVKNKTVVTVMDRAAMKENVFTNIDSTVVL